MRQVGCLAIAEAELARRKRLAVGKRAGRAADKVIHADQRADLAADHVRLGRHAQPFVQSAALIGFEMAEADVSQIRNADDTGNRFTNFRVHPPQPGVKQ